MSVETTFGPACVAMWDQGYAAARDQLARSSAFVLVTLDRETGQVDFSALSNGLAADGMIQLLDTTIGGAVDTIEEIEGLAD